MMVAVVIIIVTVVVRIDVITVASRKNNSAKLSHLQDATVMTSMQNQLTRLQRERERERERKREKEREREGEPCAAKLMRH